MRRLPVTRGDCPIERPCPHTACRYHLAEDARGPAPPSCALDIADVAERFRIDPPKHKPKDGAGLSVADLAFLLGWSPDEVWTVLDVALTKLRLRVTFTSSTPTR